jgi:deoxyribonuclease IV
MIFLGPAGYPRGYKDPYHALQMVSDLGLNALEMQFVRQARMDEKKARSIGEKAREIGLLLSAHAPYYVNFNSKRKETVEKSVEWVTRTSQIADHLGAWIVVIHAASYGGRSGTETTEAVMEGINRCLSILDDGNIKVKLGLETMGKKTSWGRLEEIGEVVSSIKETVPVLDFGHLHAICGGCLKAEEDYSNVLDQCRSFYKGPLHCHFSCIEYSDKGERRHLRLDRREPDFMPLVGPISSWDERVTVISETPSPEMDAVAMIKMLSGHDDW